MGNPKKSLSESDSRSVATGLLIALILVFLIVGIISVFSRMSGEANYLSRFSLNSQRIEELLNRIGWENRIRVQVESEDYPPQVVAEERIYNATERGQAVADYQNLFYIPNLIGDELRAVRERNYDVIDSLFMPGVRNVRVGWYVIYDGNVRTEWPDYSWQFETVHDFDMIEIPVMWRCVTDEGVVLAFTTATYDGITKRFSNMRTYVTSNGASRFVGTDSAHDANALDSTGDGWVLNKDGQWEAPDQHVYIEFDDEGNRIFFEPDVTLPGETIIVDLPEGYNHDAELNQEGGNEE